jgi:hypothetical protein
MAIHWVAFCLTDVGVLHGLLLSSCRNIARQSEGQTAATYERYALYYKYHCIRSLRSSMIEDGSAPSDQTIAKSLLLAFDEVSCATETGTSCSATMLQLTSCLLNSAWTRTLVCPRDTWMRAAGWLSSEVDSGL